MKFYWSILIIILVTASCKKNEEEIELSSDYGSGLYICTDNGISFYNGDTLINQIYKKVNSTSLLGVKKIKFKGTRAYFIANNNIYIANVNTFEDLGYISSFTDPVDFDFVNPEDRIFVVDKGDSKVKVANLEKLEVTSDIETGFNTKPIFISTRWYRSIILNGGEENIQKDSTIVAIDYKDELVPLADFMGSLYIGDNPNSAVQIDELKILCKGIYNSNDISNNTNSSLVEVNPWNMTVEQTQQLNNIYNAKNLVSKAGNNKYYFTAHDGVYKMNPNGTGVVQISSMISDVLYIKDEMYNPTDTTTAYSNMLYFNDAINNPNIIYKFNLVLSSYVDTIVVNGNVNSLNFY